MNLRTAKAGLVAIGLLAMAIPAWAGGQIERTLKLDPGGRFELDSDEGSVTVTGGDQTGANVVITSRWGDPQSSFDFSFEDGPGTVHVRARRRSFWSLFESLSLHFEIRVPRATSLEIRTGGGSISISSLQGDSDLKTSGGSIEVSRLVGKLRAQTSGGGIRVREIQGDTEIGTSGGGIEADSVNGWLAARTSGGSIHIERVAGRVDAHTSGGSIRAVLGKGNSRGGVLETSGGSIYADLDPAANLEVDASTSGGSISSDLPLRVAGKISSDSLRGILGSGGDLLRLHTNGGSIHLGSL
jgi:hypothetical protein